MSFLLLEYHSISTNSLKIEMSTTEEPMRKALGLVQVPKISMDIITATTRIVGIP